MSEELSIEQYRAELQRGAVSRPKLPSRKKQVSQPDQPGTETPPGVQVILGSPPSKSNSYRIVNDTLVKSTAMKLWEESFYMQCNLYRGVRINGFFELTLTAFFPSIRHDLDGVLKGLLDCLQTMQVIKNDKYNTAINARKFVDKQNPRIEFTLTPINL
ncbi:RusA family crossover junction endodeoxyribonuclease [Spirosoma sordidisoli]|uniref:RusA family crossover junction endodeoxyribonuclease n=1 Tax=Spirosoma sordidisoli TaxID=2502893 RepID=A0A4V1RWM1_9BACT|nr:RusA family crossover junction endodeoxyribonuclease [Spirosoma sordidisoli]RYC70748.1 RusA family crossover junction endodeoxyribonuclease [Spirosoma sordidisoli]